jgi:hypothetical protein
MAERRESVRLELNDAGFSTGMVKSAAATGMLERALKSLDGTTVNVHEHISQSSTGFDGMGRSARDADGSINQLTGRLRVLGEVAAVLAPALTPIGGVGIAGIGGLANQMGIAAVAGGVLIGSLQGVGDALGAMNDAANDPSDKNIEKAAEALERLSPAARDFAEAAFDLKPALLGIRDLGAESLIPGLTESLDDLERLAPKVGAIFEAFGGALGDIAADSAASLASERWADFFRFIETEGPTTLAELAATVGDLTHGFSELWQAFQPLNSDFSSWLMGVAEGFDDWATGLSATEGFSEFIDYIRTTGPQVADTFGAIASALVQIVQASAPLGGPVLAGLEAVANVVGTIADSDLGTPILAGVAALSLLNRSLAVTASLSKVSMSSGIFAGLGAAGAGAKKGAGGIKSLTADLSTLSKNYLIAGTASERMAAQNKKALDGLKGTARAIGPTAGLMGGLAVASSGAADGLGLTNTMSLALMGSLAGPPGIAIGVAAGALLDMKSAGEGATEAIRGLDAAIQSGNTDVLREQIAAAKAELEDINNLDFGGDIFDRIGFQVADTFGGPSADDAKADIEASEKALQDLIDAEKAHETQSRASAIAMASQAGVWMTSAEWARKSTDEIEAQAKALIESRDAAYKTANSFVTLGDSLNDGKVSLGDWIKEMSDSADALINFTRNSQTAAKKGLDEGLIASLQNAGEEGARRMRQLANATEGEIERANGAWRKGQRAMEQYVNFKVPPKRLDVDINPGMKNINALEARLRAIKDEDVFINVRQIGSGDTQLGPRITPADGATVPGPRYPYGDKIPALLAPGEEVISNRYGQADRHRALLKDINANRLADGGTADRGGKRKIVSGAAFYADDNTKALQRAIDRLTMVAEDQTDAVEHATRKTDEWSERMADVAKSTVAGFNTGLFERDSNVWAAGSGGGAVANLTRDIAGLQQRGALQSQLAGLGLSGDALAALLAQGDNADIAALIQSGQVGQYAELFNQRAALQGSVGAAAGQQAFGQQYAAALSEQRAAVAVARSTEQQIVKLNGQMARTTAALERMEASAPERTGAEVGRVINDGAATAQRNRNGNRSGARRA